MKDRMYLDYNATTPLAAEVTEAMEPFLQEAWGNPSSLHWAGAPARDAVEEARSQVAALLCCDATEIIFTSGGTEANNYAIKGLYFSRSAAGKPFHIITSQVEHPAVLEPCRFLERFGVEVTRVPVDRFGLVDPADVRRAMRPNTSLVSVMHANNEVGTIQPIAEIAAVAQRGVVLNGHPDKRLPNTLNVSFLGQQGQDLLARLPRLAASTGSACHAGSAHISPVLAAMGVTQSVGVGTVRFSLGRDTVAAEIDEVIDSLRSLVPA